MFEPQPNLGVEIQELRAADLLSPGFQARSCDSYGKAAN